MHGVMGTGRVIGGRYRLLEPIGRGAMGIVWRGRDELLARDVAVKEIQVTAHASAVDAEAIYQRTLREARTAARLSHPSVVTVFDVVEEDGSPWIVMELVNARSLDQVITEDGPLPPAEAAELGGYLISALASAHSSGVLHRDVKPSNVLVTGDGRAVLTDFGIATFAEDLGLTQAGMVVGTPGFTAPERIRGDIATPASDLWSLGATLYAAVEGRGPFDRVGGSSVITAGVAGEDAPRAPSAGPLGPVIDALLSRDPGTRPDAATAARLLASAATAAKTGPRPLHDGWLAAEADRDPGSTEDVPGPGKMRAGDSGFLDPPDYEALRIPGAVLESAGSGDSAGSGESAAAGGAGLAAAAAALAPAPEASVPAPPSAAVPAAPAAPAAPGGAEPGGLVDPNIGPVLWGPVPSTPAAAARPAGPTGPGGPGQGEPGGPGGGQGGDGAGGTNPPGRADAPRSPGRSSGRWRVMVAAAGIAALGVAALIAWNVFQHSGSASALGSSIPSGAIATTTSGTGRSGSHGSGGTHSATGASGGSRSSSPRPTPSGGKPGKASPKPSGGKPSASPSPSSSSGRSPSPSPSASARPSPSPTTTSPTSSVLPSGWKWHKFSAAIMGTVAGFKIGLPSPWTQSINPPLAQLVQPARSFHLTVNLNYWQYVKPLREAQYLQTQAAAAHKNHGYAELLLSAINFQAVGGFRSVNAAELKYSWNSVSLGYNVTELIVLVTLNTESGSQPYEFALSAPTSTFGAARGVLGTAMPTFRPMPAS